MQRNFKHKDLTSILMLLLAMLIMYILLGCEISYIYITGDNNNVKEKQTEDVNVKVDSLKVGGIKGF